MIIIPVDTCQERERRRVRFRGGGGAPADSSRVRRLRKHLPGQVVRRVPDVLLCHDLPRHGRLVPAISNRADSEVRAGALYQLCIQTFRDCHGYPGACLSGKWPRPLETSFHRTPSLQFAVARLTYLLPVGDTPSSFPARG